MRLRFAFCALLISSTLVPHLAVAEVLNGYGYDAAGNYHDGYSSSPSLNIHLDLDSWVAQTKADMARDFAALDRKPRYDEVARPFNAGNWNNYYEAYQPPVIVDTRTPQQILQDGANAGNTIGMWNLSWDYALGQNGWPQNGDMAVSWMEKAAAAGKKNAGYALYCFFAPNMTETVGIKKNIVTAIYWLRVGAKAGDPEAMAILGDRTLQGEGVDQDAGEGMRLLDAALNGGNNGALIPLLYAHEVGWGVTKDLEKAKGYAREMIKRGMSQDFQEELAQLLIETNDPKTNSGAAELAQLCKDHASNLNLLWIQAGAADSGLMGERDPVLAVGLYQKLAEGADGWSNSHKAGAQGRLADHYYLGDGVKRDDSQAMAWYQKAFGAKPEDQIASTQLNYATMLSHLNQRLADGSWKDIRDPAQAFSLAAGVCDAPDTAPALKARAAMLCATLCSRHPEVATPGHDAATMARLAAEQNPAFYVPYARGWHDGSWGQTDETKAIEAATTGDAKGVTACTLQLAQWKAEDSGGKDADWKNLMHRAVAGGAPGAREWMATLLGDGKWLTKNTALALQMLREEATQNPNAANTLGVVLWRGDWGEKNVTEALSWLQKSLDARYYPAGRNLAKIYHLGIGVPKDEDKARVALEKCGEVGGHDGALIAAEAFAKGDIINADPVAAARWKLQANS